MAGGYEEPRGVGGSGTPNVFVPARYQDRVGSPLNSGEVVHDSLRDVCVHGHLRRAVVKRPMIKFPSAAAEGSIPSGSSKAVTKPGVSDRGQGSGRGGRGTAGRTWQPSEPEPDLMPP